MWHYQLTRAANLNFKYSFFDAMFLFKKIVLGKNELM